MKIRLNTVKSKVLAGVATVTLVSGAGFVAANTDVGAGLQNWYDDAFGKAESKIATDVTKYGEGKIPGLYNEYQSVKTNAGVGIDASKNTEANHRTANINEAKDKHVSILNVKEDEISNYMASEFDGVSSFAKGLINQLGNQAKDYAYNDLKKFTDSKGSNALTQLQSELEAEKNAAVSELEGKIVKSKEALYTQLQRETAATTEELKTEIDNKIVELRGLITAKADQLMRVQVDLITAEGQRLENEAFGALDQVVADMNN